jgi:DNA repair photolyase
MSTPPPGRAAGSNPKNRFEATALEPIEIDWIDDDDVGPRQIRTEVYLDRSRSILSENDSPDLPFRYGVNPYRGCEHGCIYCYARPSHEYIGFSAGLDFESKIIAKPAAPELLAAEFNKKSWTPEMISLSGNTDPYQPVERTMGITRRLLETFLRHRNPLGLITKNSLIMRDIDLLADLARRRLVGVCISITTLDPEIAHAMEPRASTPARRLDAIRALAAAQIPVGVNVAPIVPGLTDEEVPAILKAAREAGATRAGWIMMRLPGAVNPLFIDWIERVFPARAAKVLSRIRDIRGGELHSTTFGERMRGTGPFAEITKRLFEVTTQRLGYVKQWPDLSTAEFRRFGDDRAVEVQGELFGGA